MRYFLLGCCFTVFNLFSQQATISGRLSGADGAVPFSLVTLEPGSQKTLTDANGAFSFAVSSKQQVTLHTSPDGYETARYELAVFADSVYTIDWKLTTIASELNTVVITGTRTPRRRTDSPIAVNLLDAKTLQRTQSLTLSEGLSYQPGLRMETDCQTCNYTQVRMNGLGGSYSQILINGRPLFSSLMGLYGLEQIPANAIDRVEVVRGGGSVVYGSNAIAGTINVLTKLPVTDAFSVQMNSAYIDGQAPDLNLQANVTAVSDSARTGFSIFTGLRKRGAYDANGDGYSEMPKLTGINVGLSGFAQLSERAVLEASLWHIQEERRGGNAIDARPDVADQSEYRLQNSSIGQLALKWNDRSGKSSLQVYTGGQLTNRTHYTGIDHADGWGNTRNLTVQSGVQFTRQLRLGALGKMDVTTGLEHLHDDTYDAIPGYNYEIDQVVNQAGLYVQSDWELTKKWSLLAGIRGTKHSLLQTVVATPRIALLFKPARQWQLRAGYGRGFKAPQAFETDMHIAFASGGISTIQRAPGLKSELSDSWTFSVDFNTSKKRYAAGFTLSGFATTLRNAYVLTEIGQDSLGNMRLLRENGGTANVYGVTLEGRWKWSKWLQADAGYTLQQSYYNEPVAWSAELPAERRFLRTPNDYGFASITILPDQPLSGTISGVYTETMLVPHFGGAPETPVDVVLHSPQFFDCTVRLAYKLHLHGMEQNIELGGGVQNLFDQYQTDFDTGKNRDSNYIYGPARPRTVFLSLKWSSSDH